MSNILLWFTYTADALFNFPAYHSVSLWSKAAPAFLYSFEHKGNLTKGGHFLPGVPLAGIYLYILKTLINKTLSYKMCMYFSNIKLLSTRFADTGRRCSQWTSAWR